MKITVKTNNPQHLYKDLHAGDCFFFIEQDIGVNKKDPYIKTDEGDCVSLIDGVCIHSEMIYSGNPVQKIEAELIIE